MLPSSPMDVTNATAILNLVAHYLQHLSNDQWPWEKRASFLGLLTLKRIFQKKKKLKQGHHWATEKCICFFAISDFYIEVRSASCVHPCRNMCQNQVQPANPPTNPHTHPKPTPQTHPKPNPNPPQTQPKPTPNPPQPP